MLMYKTNTRSLDKVTEPSSRQGALRLMAFDSLDQTPLAEMTSDLDA